MGDWAYAHAVRTGVAPGKTDCQDFALVATAGLKGGKEACVLVVSDGAGSAKEGAVGAKLACLAFAGEAERMLRERKGVTGLGKSQAAQVLGHVHRVLISHAELQGVRAAEFSCTVVGAVLGPDGAWFVQIGDGSSVFWRRGVFDVAIWPEHGEYVNETVFVTDPKFEGRIQSRSLRGAVDGAVLFSDGLQFLVLDYQAQKPHVPFFQKVTRALSQQDPGCSEVVSKWLDEAVLASPSVTSKTDDDLSLVVAVRRDDGGN